MNTTASGLGRRRRSALETASCLYRFNAIYNEGIQDVNPFSQRGIGYDAVKKAYIERLFKLRLISDAEEARMAFIEGIASAQTPAHLVGDVRALFQTEAERFEFDPDAYIASEQPTFSGDEVPFVPDLVYAYGNTLKIIDDKTYFKVLTDQQARATLQSRMYIRRAMVEWPGFDTYEFTFRFVRYGSEVSVTFDAQKLEELELEVEAINAMLDHAAATGSWPATPGDWCGLCTLRCPVADDPKVRQVRLISPEAVKSSAQRYLALAAALKHERAALESYCTLNGDVEEGGAVFGFRPTRTTKYPAATVVDTLRGHGVEPSFTIGTAPVRSYLTAKKWAHVKPSIDALAHAKDGSKFVVGRAVEPVDGDTNENGDDE